MAGPDTPRFAIPQLADKQGDAYITHNEALRIFEILVQATVTDRDLTSPPPGSPPAAEGEVYLIPTGSPAASGDWTGHDGEFAQWFNGTWEFQPVLEGYRVWVADENLLIAATADGGGSWDEIGGGGGSSTFEVLVSANDTTQGFLSAKVVAGPGIAVAVLNDGGDEDLQFSMDISGNAGQLPVVNAGETAISWQDRSYEVSIDVPGSPDADEVVRHHIIPRAVTFPSGLSGSVGWAKTVAYAQTDLDVQKNGSSVGTIRFAAATGAPTFIMASATSFAAGDRLEIVAPSSPDATLADFAVTLVASIDAPA